MSSGCALSPGFYIRASDAAAWSFNAVCQLGWNNKITNGVTLHKQTYYDHRALTGLPSQLVCAARVKATEALKSVGKLLKQKKNVSCPKSKHCPIRYDARSYTVWFDRNEVTILAIGGRIKLKFELSQYYRQYTRKLGRGNLAPLSSAPVRSGGGSPRK